MPRRYIARHGQDEDNARGILNGHRNFPLTDDIGRPQARLLAQGIKRLGLQFATVYASPLRRAYETAEIVTSYLGLPSPVVMDGLIERDFGVMTGLPVSEIEKRCAPDIIKTDQVTYFLSPEGAETFILLYDRAKRVLAEVDAKHPDEDVLLVTHGDIGKMLYTAYYNRWWIDVLIGFHFGNSELLELSPAADPKQPHIIRVDQHN